MVALVADGLKQAILDFSYPILTKIVRLWCSLTSAVLVLSESSCWFLIEVLLHLAGVTVVHVCKQVETPFSPSICQAYPGRLSQ